MNTDNNPPQGLEDTWIIGNDYLTDLVCETHAREYAAQNGLVFEYEGFTEENPNGYAYSLFSGSDIESDYPHACSWCGVYLDASLTEDGRQYVRENYSREWWHLWEIEA